MHVIRSVDTDTPATVPASVLDGIRSLAEGLNGKTWKANRAAILDVLGKAEKS